MKSALLLFTLVSLLLSCGCARRQGDCGASLSAPVVAWLSKARALHHAADAVEDGGDIDRAVTLLGELVAGPRPAGVEVDEVLADTHARLAELRAKKGDYEAAMADTRARLGLATSATYFRGHLFEVQGLVLSRRAKDARANGDEQNAERWRQAAIQASMEAVRIQDEVIRRTLRDR